MNKQSLALNPVENRTKLIKVCTELTKHSKLDDVWLGAEGGHHASGQIPMSEIAELLTSIKPLRGK